MESPRAAEAFVIVRAWIEAGPPRTIKIRVLTARNADATAKVIGVTSDIDRACSLVREWLTELAGVGWSPPPRD